MPGSRGVLVFDDVGLRVNRNAVDGEKEIAALDAGAGAGRSGGYLDGRDTFGAGTPEDAVLDLMPPGVGDDVRDAERRREGGQRQAQRQCGPRPASGLRQAPLVPPSGRRVARVHDWAWRHSLSI